MASHPALGRVFEEVSTDLFSVPTLWCTITFCEDGKYMRYKLPDQNTMKIE